MAISALEQIKGIARASSSIDTQVQTLYYIMKEFGWTIFEVQELPIPTFQIIVQLMQKDAKKGRSKKHR